MTRLIHKWLQGPKHLMQAVDDFLVWYFVFTIRFYQRHASYELRHSCRFAPSCSVYAIGALTQYGFVRGSGLTVRRLWRCRPPNGGIDNP